MDLTDLLKIERCLCLPAFADKTACLAELARRATNELGLKAAPVLQALQQREALGSTGLGNGIALPHARLAELDEPFVLLAKLKSPLDFESIDDQRVDLVCLVLLPASMAKDQLSVLSCVARGLRRPELVARAREAREGPTLFKAFQAASAA